MTEYDFVVVGGGTAGLVLACRLSENPGVNVLVLEAGSDHSSDPRVNIPALWHSIMGNVDFDWNFTTNPQKHLRERCIAQPQGKMLGGSSAINAQAMIAASKTALNAWGKLGNCGWDWKTMAPYYEKTRTITFPPEPHRQHLGINWAGSGMSGGSGPVQGSFQEASDDPIPKAWVDTFEALNYKLSTDPFSGDALGGFNNPITVDPISKTRSSSTAAYYTPVKDRENLTVLTEAVVGKIILETKRETSIHGNNGNHVVATGVEFVHQGGPKCIKARKEVILAAGALQSPKLWEISGVGSSKVLQLHKIPTIIDNPFVGENLQDHLFAALYFEVNDEVVTKDDFMRRVPTVLENAMAEYQTSRTGPLCVGAVTSFAIMPLLDFLSEAGRTTQRELLDQYLDTKAQTVLPSQPSQYSFLRSILENPTEGSASYFLTPVQAGLGSNLKTVIPGNFITLCTSVLNPFSRGSVHISSSDAAQQPNIDPNYLGHPLDIEIFARHLQYLETIAATQPFASLLKPGGIRAPSMRDLDAAKEFVRDYAISNWHPVGSCAMLPRDLGGVVGERLVVYGTKNLRVVDSSIMPIISRGNPQTTVYAVAERAADLIKEDWGL